MMWVAVLNSVARDWSQVRTGQRFLASIKNKTPAAFAAGVFFFRSLAMTYSHMGKPHTTIGDTSFHY